MRNILTLILMTPLFLMSCKGKEKISEEWLSDTDLHIIFYNVENLFDIENDPATADDEFTPGTEKNWTKDRYEIKLNHLEKVITATGVAPDIIGFCEVENRGVVEDLMTTGKLRGFDYTIVHKDSPDGRGIDCALAFNSKKVKLLAEDYIESKLPVGDRPNTRLAMHTKLLCGDDTLHVFVNHWPSRYGGQEYSEANRLTVAHNVRQKLDLIQSRDPNAQILLMGDFNDYPNNKSLNKVLGAGNGDRYPFQNLMWNKHKSGQGSYNYKGDWGCLDQFIVSENLVNGEGNWATSEDSAEIVRRDWMMYVNDEGEAYPSRTYGGPNYYGGYSDHLPIYLILDNID